MKYKIIVTFYLLFFSTFGFSQVNNLQHTEGYQTAEWAKLEEVKKFGTGDQNMILLPGWGFDWTIFQDYIERNKEEYTFYAVTFPGMGKTSAPPMPEENEKFSNLYWTKGILKGLKDLIETENIENPILTSCFTYSNVIAMRMALDYPDLIQKVVIISGMAKFTATYPSMEPRNLQQRIYYVDQQLSKNWFKGVSKTTWDNGNFFPETFSTDSTKAAKYWEQMSSVPIPIMVRYLCEYYCTDLSLEYQNLQVPVLVVVPAFTPNLFKMDGAGYFSAFFHHSWLGAKEKSKQIHIITLSNTHAFVMEDQPDKLDQVIKTFVAGELNPFDIFR